MLRRAPMGEVVIADDQAERLAAGHAEFLRIDLVEQIALIEIGARSRSRTMSAQVAARMRSLTLLTPSLARTR